MSILPHSGKIAWNLPLWGKMLNVERSRLDKVYGNEKLMPVVTEMCIRDRGKPG